MHKVLYKYNYEVCRNGTVYSILSKRLMGVFVAKTGYCLVNITYKKKKTTMYLHRVVAECFIENKDNKKCVNHKDGNKKNNSVENLEWVTYLENSIHKQNILGKTNRGENCGTSKLTERQVLNIKKSDKSQTELAIIYGVCQSHISNIVNNKRWTNI